VPLVFGGQVTDTVLRLWEFLGAQANTLRGLNVMPVTGQGGYVVAHQRTVVMSVSFPVNTIVVLLLSPRGFYRLRRRGPLHISTLGVHPADFLTVRARNLPLDDTKCGKTASRQRQGSGKAAADRL
jgi:hypothetical protein